MAHLVQPHRRVLRACARLAVGILCSSPGVPQPLRLLHHRGALVVDGVPRRHAVHGVDERRVQRHAGGVADLGRAGGLDVLVHQLCEPPVGCELPRQRVAGKHKRRVLRCLARLAGEDVRVGGHRVQRGQLRGADAVARAAHADVEAIRVEGGTGGVEKLQHDRVRAHVRQVEAEVKLELHRAARGQLPIDVARVPDHPIFLRVRDGGVALLGQVAHGRRAPRYDREAVERVVGMVSHAKFHVKRVVRGQRARCVDELNARDLPLPRTDGLVGPLLCNLGVIRCQRHGGGGENDGRQRGNPVHRGVALPA